MEKCSKDMSLLLKQALFQCKSVTALACLTFFFIHTRHTVSFTHLSIFFYVLIPRVGVDQLMKGLVEINNRNVGEMSFYSARKIVSIVRR